MPESWLLRMLSLARRPALTSRSPCRETRLRARRGGSCLRRVRMASISLNECFTIVDFKFLLAGVLSAAMSNDSSPCRYRTTPCTNTFPIGGHGQLDKKVLETFPTNDSLRPTRERHLDRRRDRRLCRLRRQIPIPPTRRASVLQDAVREAQGLGLYSLSLPETIGPWFSYR
jgi:hypothetical protein